MDEYSIEVVNKEGTFKYHFRDQEAVNKSFDDDLNLPITFTPYITTLKDIDLNPGDVYLLQVGKDQVRYYRSREIDSIRMKILKWFMGLFGLIVIKERNK
jgi:methyl coenzyme M reductase subunit C-like uncharacterized protein (methanogenesis marker protein 7)